MGLLCGNVGCPANVNDATFSLDVLAVVVNFEADIELAPPIDGSPKILNLNFEFELQ